MKSIRKEVKRCTNQSATKITEPCSPKPIYCSPVSQGDLCKLPHCLILTKVKSGKTFSLEGFCLTCVEGTRTIYFFSSRQGHIKTCKCEKISFCCTNHSFCGVLLWKFSTHTNAVCCVQSSFMIII